MIEIIKYVFWFVCKLVLIEWTIELIRMFVYAIVNNVWPQNPYEVDKWSSLDWCIYWLETAIVALMLYIEYSPITIVVATYLILLIIKQSIFFARRLF